VVARVGEAVGVAVALDRVDVGGGNAGGGDDVVLVLERLHGIADVGAAAVVDAEVGGGDRRDGGRIELEERVAVLGDAGVVGRAADQRQVAVDVADELQRDRG